MEDYLTLIKLMKKKGGECDLLLLNQINPSFRSAIGDFDTTTNSTKKKKYSDLLLY